jgi:hypothetical protein
VREGLLGADIFKISLLIAHLSLSISHINLCYSLRSNKSCKLELEERKPRYVWITNGRIFMYLHIIFVGIIGSRDLNGIL